ncbi:hypothetical protein H6P81_011880 [Aristolochia fimbriata]|uniref:Uncharacterized protein n=1 Tax=Aristolochia fimbriata TaxID=158543 RepID=A0AAV7EDZ8_ARIFI|nr:hypothetical protein H6P81_011880 [Aristolochia fimbriata]
MQTSIKCACTGGIVEMEKTVIAKKDVWNSKELFCHRNTVSGEAEENRFTISASDLKAILQKINQEQHKNSEVNRRKGKVSQDVKKRWGREVKIPHTGLVSCNEHLEQPCLSLIEVRTSNSFSILCRTTEPFNFPLNFSPKKQYLLNAFKPHKRRTLSTGDLSKFVSECTLPSWPGNGIIHPTGQWIVNAIEGKDKVRNLLRNHIISMVSEIGSGGMRPVDAFDGGNISGLTRSPPTLKLLPSKPILQKRYGSDAPDSILASCSSTKSTSSCQSSSSSCGVPLKGVLHCTRNGGLPSFEFSVDDRSDVYVANPSRVKFLSRSSNDKTPDFVYLFHSRSDGAKANVSSRNDLSETVARMKVSSCLTLDRDNQKHIETEYVLFGSNEFNSGEMQSSATAPRKHKGLQKRVVDVFRANNTSRHKPRPRFKDIPEESKMDAFCKLDDLSMDSLNDNEPLPCLELAAIVVEASVQSTSQVESNEGWGLKFLKNATAARSKRGCLQNGSKSDISIKALIPAAPHGGPRTRHGGPSGIIERWRSGGHCDCGGWDVGCPLTVLSNNSCKSPSIPLPDTDDDCKSFDLFIEGSKEVGPALKIVNVREGLDFVYFQPSLSSLQSFSVAVAFIHSRNPALNLEVCQS